MYYECADATDDDIENDTNESVCLSLHTSVFFLVAILTCVLIIMSTFV